MTSLTDADLAGTVLAGKYQLGRLIGRGGMGAVYEAIGPDQTTVAVKVLRTKGDENDESLMTRLLREGKLAQRLEGSSHLVSVLDVGTYGADHLPFLVMPFLKGCDARALLESVRCLAPAVAARIAFQACEGLAAIHKKEIVHRDIKPSNLFLEDTPDGSVVVRICDFGIAKTSGDSELTQLTNTGVRMGTPLYMSPESMVSGASSVADPRRDVYGIAASLYELLCGVPAWGSLHGEDGGFAALALKVASQDPPRLDERAPWIDRDLAALVARAMSRDPEARPKDAHAFATLLRPFCGDGVGLTPEMLRAFDPKAAVVRSDDHPQAQDEDDDKDPLIGTLVDHRYRIVRLLGRGGMGAVYEAVPNDDRAVNVAIKVISETVSRSDARAIQRFLREATAIRSLDSPNVVRVLEAGTDATLGSPFLVMELLRGVELGTLIKERGAIATEPALRVFLQAARGIQAAHARGIIHRDIKPQNLFLHVGDDDRDDGHVGEITVKVCDFGIAKQSELLEEIASQELTRTGGVLGSPRYMSPEQAQDAKRVSARSDIWSLCISLYETLSGRRVWAECKTLGEIIVAICTRPVRRLEEVAPWVDPSVAKLIARGLAIAPEDRYASMEEMIAEIEKLLGETSKGKDAPIMLADLRHHDLATTSTSSDVAIAADAAVDGEFSTQRTISLVDVPRGRSRTMLWVMAVGAVAFLIATGYAIASSSSSSSSSTTTTKTSSSVTSTPSASVRPTPIAYALNVSPADAHVIVDGHEAAVSSGAVALEGQPGDMFVVDVDVGGARKTERVFITRDHRLEPPRVVLEVSPTMVTTTTTTTTTTTATTIATAIADPIKRSPVRPTSSSSSAPPPASSATPPQPSSSNAPPIKARETW